MESLIALLTLVLTMSNNAFVATHTPAEPKAETAITSTAKKTKSDNLVSTKPIGNISREYKNALKQAENYLKYSAFSKQALFDQLTSEYGSKFPEDAAQFAIDNLVVDYKEQALRAAKSYLEYSSFSDQGLYEQLISEYGGQFTEEEAQYAIDHLD